MAVSRRTFLKGAGATAAGAGALRLLAGPETLVENAAAAETPIKIDTINTTCWIGKQDCSMIAHRVNGRVIKFEGNPVNPRNLGTLCPKGQGQIQAIYDPNRVKTPLKRTNAKGAPGEWKAVTWEEAMTEVSTTVKEVLDRDPSLVLWQKGRSKSKELYDEAFVEALGCSKLGHGAYCSDAGYRAMEYTVGLKGVLNPDLEHAQLVLAWGWNAVEAGGNQLCYITWPRQLLEARERGARFVFIDPRIRGAGPFADEWLPIKPGSDLALALALSNQLIQNDTIDRDYLTTYTNGPYLVEESGYFARKGETELVWDERTGAPVPVRTEGARQALEGTFELPSGKPVRTAFQVFKDQVAQYTPDFVAEACGIPAEQVSGLAELIGEKAMIGSTIEIDGKDLPLRPVGVMAYHAMQQELGFQATRAMAQMLMLIGALGAVGGATATSKWEIDDKYIDNDSIEVAEPPYGFTLSESKYFPINSGSPSIMARVMLDPEKYGVEALPEVMIIHMTNPVVAFPNNDDIKAAYAKFRHITVLSPWLTETADLFADIVLPTATIEKYEGPLSATDTIVDAKTMRIPPMDPLFESRGEIDIYLDLTERLGVLEHYLEFANEHLELTEEFAIPLDSKPTARDILDRWSQMEGLEGGIDFFAKEGAWVKGRIAPEERYGYAVEPPFGGVVHRFYGESLQRYQDEQKALGADEVYWQDYTPLPVWREPTMYSSPTTYDLTLISFKKVELKQGRTVLIPMLAELAGHQRVVLNAKTAATKGLAEDDWVIVESHNAVTGETKQLKTQVHLTETLRPDVAAMSHGYGLWMNPGTSDYGPTPNVLFFSGEGYVTNTADQSFQVRVRVTPTDGQEA